MTDILVQSVYHSKHHVHLIGGSTMMPDFLNMLKENLYKINVYVLLCGC